MPKGAKKRAKLKKQQQQQGHPDDGGNNTHHNGNGNNNTASGRPDHNLWIPPKVSHADASEDSMESSEEMVTPRAAGSERDEERKAAADVTVERAVQAVEKGDVAAGDCGEEVMVDALPPETSGQACQGKDDADLEVHAVVQEPEVKNVVVDEAPVVQEAEVAEAPLGEVPEVKMEVAKVHPVHELEPKVDEAVVVWETPAPPVVHEPEIKGGNVVVKDSTEVLRSSEVDVRTSEVDRGPAVAVVALGQRATWWNCCGLFDAFSGLER